MKFWHFEDGKWNPRQGLAYIILGLLIPESGSSYPGTYVELMLYQSCIRLPNSDQSAPQYSDGTRTDDKRKLDSKTAVS